jgi:phage-related protein
LKKIREFRFYKERFLSFYFEIYEVRVLTSEKSIRILCFKEKEELIVLTNCFVKKSQKTPIKEIRLAEKLKKDYSYGKD